MNLPIEFRRTAKAEYDDASLWYDTERTGLGSVFEAAVQAVLSIIAGQPDRYPIAERDIREADVLGFPYCVYYRVRSERIIVVAVFHQSRDPAEWKSRV